MPVDPKRLDRDLSAALDKICKATVDATVKATLKALTANTRLSQELLPDSYIEIGGAAGRAAGTATLLAVAKEVLLNGRLMHHYAVAARDQEQRRRRRLRKTKGGGRPPTVPWRAKVSDLLQRNRHLDAITILERLEGSGLIEVADQTVVVRDSIGAPGMKIPTRQFRQQIYRIKNQIVKKPISQNYR